MVRGRSRVGRRRLGSSWSVVVAAVALAVLVPSAAWANDVARSAPGSTSVQLTTPLVLWIAVGGLALVGGVLAAGRRRVRLSREDERDA